MMCMMHGERKSQMSTYLTSCAVITEQPICQQNNAKEIKNPASRELVFPPDKFYSAKKAGKRSFWLSPASRGRFRGHLYSSCCRKITL